MANPYSPTRRVVFLVHENGHIFGWELDRYVGDGLEAIYSIPVGDHNNVPMSYIKNARAATIAEAWPLYLAMDKIYMTQTIWPTKPDWVSITKALYPDGAGFSTGKTGAYGPPGHAGKYATANIKADNFGIRETIKDVKTDNTDIRETIKDVKTDNTDIWQAIKDLTDIVDTAIADGKDATSDIRNDIQILAVADEVNEKSIAAVNARNEKSIAAVNARAATLSHKHGSHIHYVNGVIKYPPTPA